MNYRKVYIKVKPKRKPKKKPVYETKVARKKKLISIYETVTRVVASRKAFNKLPRKWIHV